MISAYVNFRDAIHHHIDQLKRYGAPVDTGHWQGVPTEGKPDLQTLELMDVAFRTTVPYSLQELRDQIQPNLPWADDHFEERVGREPTNPGVTFQEWPWWRGQYATTHATAYVGEPTHMVKDAFKFSHTYQERFWPKQAGDFNPFEEQHLGIRYPYGDLDDVINLLVREPYTRQAYLPIFFPEDTGAVHGGRIPCTLGYHFLLRRGLLHSWYEIRSCDAVRHFRDDLYLAARLVLWVLEEVTQRAIDTQPDGHTLEAWDYVKPGTMTFHCHSFHVHQGDLHHLDPRRA